MYWKKTVNNYKKDHNKLTTIKRYLERKYISGHKTALINKTDMKSVMGKS